MAPVSYPTVGEIALSLTSLPLVACGIGSKKLGRTLSKWIIPGEITPPPLPNTFLTFDLTDQVKTVQATDGSTLRGRVVRYPNSTRWLIRCGGNCESARGSTPWLYAIANHFRLNVLQMDYRGTGESDGPRPSSFQDLANDALVVANQLMNDEHIDRSNITLDGFSLGGSVAVWLAQRLRCPVVVHNTFSSLTNLVIALISQLATWTAEFIRDTRDALIESPHPLSLRTKLLLAAKDILGSPFELATRTIYYAYRFFRCLVLCQFREVLSALYEIAKTLVIDPLLTITGILTLFTCFFTDRPIVWNAHLNKALLGNNTSLVEIAMATFLPPIARIILKRTGWHCDTAAIWSELQQSKLAFFAPNDEVVTFEASLAAGQTSNVKALPTHFRHVNTGMQTREYERFVTSSFAI